MALFDAYHVYSVNPRTAAFDCRVGTDVQPTDPLMKPTDYKWPFLVSGLNIQDLAVFASVIDEDGSQEYGYLVTKTGEVSELVQPFVLEVDQSLITPELARRFATVTYEEVASLGIERVVELTRQQFPNALPLFD